MRYVFIVLASVIITVAPSIAQNTFPPASFKNLQVLPKDSPARVVVGTMKGFANNLGCGAARDLHHLPSRQVDTDKYQGAVGDAACSS